MKQDREVVSLSGFTWSGSSEHVEQEGFCSSPISHYSFLDRPHVEPLMDKISLAFEARIGYIFNSDFGRGAFV